MEHGHDAAQRVGRGQTHGIGQRLHERVQILRTVFVFDALWITSGPAGVTQTERAGLGDLRPVVVLGLASDEVLVVDGIGQGRRPTFEARFGRHDNLAHSRNHVGNGLEHW